MKKTKLPYPENLFHDLGCTIHLPLTSDQEEGLSYALKTYLRIRYAEAVKKRYMDGQSYAGIGKDMGISTERVRQLVKRSIENLRGAKPLGYIAFGKKNFEKILEKEEYAVKGYVNAAGRKLIFDKVKLKPKEKKTPVRREAEGESFL